MSERARRIYLDFKNDSYYSPSKSYTSGNIDYDPTSGDISFEGSTTMYQGSLRREGYYIEFQFYPDDQFDSTLQFFRGNDIIEEISFGKSFNNMNKRKFIRFIKNLYSTKSLFKIKHRDARYL